MSNKKLSRIKDNYAKEKFDEKHVTWSDLVEGDVTFYSNEVDELMDRAYNQALLDFSLEIAKYEYDLKNINKVILKLKL